MTCYSCGEDTVLEVDGAHTVCTRCGTVLEESNIVSEITFGETGGGAAMVQGSYVGADQTRARAPAGYRQKGGGQESREQTMLNGRRRMQLLAVALRLPDRLTDAGQRYFNLAVNMNFVQGRRTQYVVAACLYSACRMDKTSHMLIDFSDLLEINVFVLGSTYLKLVKELSLQLPSVDPSLYISRFAALLEFGDETQKVAQDAVRLVARMGRDWMHIGRRPAGVCGACLLLAARMNNFRRSITEVVQVVKIADVTLRKRLDEFKDTPSGALTVADFRTLWLDETADPPAFTMSQKREKKAREEMETKRRKLIEDAGEEDEGFVAAMRSEDGGEVQEGRDAFDELAAMEEGSSMRRDGSEDPEDEDRALMPPPPKPSAKALGKRKRREETQEEEGGEEEEEEEREAHMNSPELDDAIQDTIQQHLNTDDHSQIVDELDKADAKRIEMAGQMTNLNTSDRLDDLDEDELDMFILTPQEVEDKSRLWMQINKDYLQQLADKQTGPDGELKPITARRVRKRNKPRDSTTATGGNAAEATKQMLTKKRFSKKINYAAIEELFAGGGGSRASSVAGDEDEENDEDAASSRAGSEAPLLGQVHGPSKSFLRKSRQSSQTPRFAKGQPIITPAAPWSTRSNTSRAGSERAPSVMEDEEEEDQHERQASPEEEVEDWRKMMGAGRDEDDYPVDDYA